jgi:uncharacterized membrane protein HdeD (DUF308 family)
MTSDPHATGSPGITPTETAMTRPPFDPTALLLGIALTVIALLALLDPTRLRRLDLSVLVPAVLVIVGAVLVTTALSARRSRDLQER